MWCTCGARDGFSAVYDEQGQTDFWVCTKCRLPTKMYLEELTKMVMAPIGAVSVLSSRSRQDGIHEIRWAMSDGTKKQTYEYSPFPTRRQGGPAVTDEGPSLLQRTWYLLDSKMDVIRNPNSDKDEMLRAKFEARGIAQVLEMFMVPHFGTADEIAREAVRRYDARQAGDDTYETAGLGMRKYEPPKGDDKYTAATPEPKKTATRKKTPKQIPAEAVPNVKMALETKMFTLAMVAKTYGMTEAEVKTQLGLP